MPRRRILRRTLARLFPSLCGNCAHPLTPEEKRICAECLATWSQEWRSPACRGCGVAVQQGQQYCRGCRAHPPPWHALLVLSTPSLEKYCAQAISSAAALEGPLASMGALRLLKSSFPIPSSLLYLPGPRWKRCLKGPSANTVFSKSMSRLLSRPSLPFENKLPAPTAGLRCWLTTEPSSLQNLREQGATLSPPWILLSVFPPH